MKLYPMKEQVSAKTDAEMEKLMATKEEERKQLWRNIRQVLYNMISAIVGAVTMYLTGGAQ